MLAALVPSGVPASRAGVCQLLQLRSLPELTGPLLRLVCRRGPVSAQGLGPAQNLGVQPCPSPGADGHQSKTAPRPRSCTRKAECPRADESGHWLWSRNESCVAVTGAHPQNMSRQAQGEVSGDGRGPTQGRAPGCGAGPGHRDSILCVVPFDLGCPENPGQTQALSQE